MANMMPTLALAIAVAAMACCSVAQGHVGGPWGQLSPVHYINVEATTIDLDASITIAANATTVVNGDWVTVSWSGVAQPSSMDWVGVFSPSTTDMTKHTPIKFQFANKSMNYLTTGAGSFEFNLLNLRADYIFAFMRNGIWEPVVAATSKTVGFKNYDVPLEIHLAHVSDHVMRVMWTTKTSASPMAHWRAPGAATYFTAAATTQTYTADMLCGSPANSTGWRDPGMIHSVMMTNLVSGKPYEYRVGGDNGWSDWITFNAPPIVGPATDAHFIAFGDLGRGEIDDSIDGRYWKWGDYQPSLWTTNALKNMMDDFDMVLNIGDTSYADGVASEWDEFFHQIAPIAQSKPWMTCIGNHELDWPVEFSFFNSTDSQGECGIPQEYRFGMPRPDGEVKPWYSFNYGNVHVTLMSTEHHWMPGSEQYEWLVADLKAINHTKTPWTIFSGHRPFYVDSTWNAPPDGDGYVASELRSVYEKLLVESQVDLAIFGHHHTYQRSCAVFESECVQSSKDGYFNKPGVPIYSVIGMAGAPFTTNFKPTRPSYFEFVDDKNHGYFRIDTTADTMHAQFVALDGTGNDSVLDEFWITH